jgi:hypothetical protein
MQETPQVGWDPISINYHLPLASKLLILYLGVVVTVSLMKSVSVLRMLWSFTLDSGRTTSSEDEFLYAWETCSNRIQSMQRLIFITLFWTILVATLLLRNTLTLIVEQKVVGPAALGGGVVEVLTVFALGILACAVLYSACAFYEGALLRRRESWNHARATRGGRPPG